MKRRNTEGEETLLPKDTWKEAPTLLKRIWLISFPILVYISGNRRNCGQVDLNVASGGNTLNRHRDFLVSNERKQQPVQN